jgi:hypothetical protein
MFKLIKKSRTNPGRGMISIAAMSATAAIGHALTVCSATAHARSLELLPVWHIDLLYRPLLMNSPSKPLFKHSLI